MLIVTMQNTGKAPRFLILHIKNKQKNPQKLSKLFKSIICYKM